MYKYLYVYMYICLIYIYNPLTHALSLFSHISNLQSPIQFPPGYMQRSYWFLLRLNERAYAVSYKKSINTIHTCSFLAIFSNNSAAEPGSTEQKFHGGRGVQTISETHLSKEYSRVWSSCISWYIFMSVLRDAFELVLSNVLRSEVCHIYTTRGKLRIESCHFVTSLVTHEWVMLHLCRSHDTHMNVSCHTCEPVMSRIWISHVTCMNKACHTYKRVTSHKWIRHILHVSMPYCAKKLVG